MNTGVLPQAHWLNLAGWLHLLLYGVALPILVLRNSRAVAAGVLPLPPRLLHFRSTSVMLLLLTLGSVGVSWSQRMTLFPDELPPLRGVAAGLAMYALAILIMRPRWREAVVKRARVVHLFVAETVEERAWWVLVSLLAGIGEEISWRGVQTGLLVPLAGSYWLAAVLCAVSFALAHAVQGWRSMLGIFAFAIAFQLVVVATGSLYVAMAVHVAYDVTAGFAYGRIARETGFVPDLGHEAAG